MQGNSSDKHRLLKSFNDENTEEMVLAEAEVDAYENLVDSDFEEQKSMVIFKLVTTSTKQDLTIAEAKHKMDEFYNALEQADKISEEHEKLVKKFADTLTETKFAGINEKKFADKLNKEEFAEKFAEKFADKLYNTWNKDMVLIIVTYTIVGFMSGVILAITLNLLK
ncbi:hypothetical protein Hamer_G009997 [Homarus americanus]|uniref:Uncharacterized protein n=1 Tax=Homarus americanus TaxID=6706 RepID=A0A8J5MMR1_HOMAM|nr:hypothetical protein Hamer_G009997 [Homarus americanus]